MLASDGHNYRISVTYGAETGIPTDADLANVNADWGGQWDAVDDEGNPIYIWDESRQEYYTYAYLNGTVDEPPYIPVSENTDERFVYWSPVRYTDSGEVAYPYDFSTPSEGEIILYGFWANAIQVPYHVVDASAEVLEEVDEWKKENQEFFRVNTGTDIPLGSSTDTENYVNIPSSYEYAFACVSDSLEHCSEDGIITRIGYNMETKRVSVTYADGTTEDLPSDKEIYLVYFENPKTIPIDYKVMNTDESLTDVNVSGNAPISASVGSYDMTSSVTGPLVWANNPDYRYYSYAIGDLNATEASQVHVITGSVNSDTSRPNLQIRNTWRGYQYSTDGGNTWANYGYDPALYVLYYPSEPTIVKINEETIGTLADMDEEFEYEIVITETRTEKTETRTRTKNYHSNYIVGYWDRTWSSWSAVTSIEESTVTEIASYAHNLSDGESETNTLFFSESNGTWTNPGDDVYEESGNVRTQTSTRRTVTVTQTITVTQRPKDGFTTTNDGAAGDQFYVYTYTTTSTNEDQEVTYTNTRTKEDIILHVALAENGGFVAHDTDLRTEDESVYTVSIPSGQTVELSESNPSGLFTGDTTQYHFAGIIYGKNDGEGNITAYYTDVNSVSFAQLSDSEYLGLYTNDEPDKLIEEGYEIYYVYYQMPKIVYVQEGANGALTLIDPIERNRQFVTLNGITTAQNTQLEVGTNAFVIDQSVNGGYRVPPDLDGHSARSLDYVKIGAGAADVTNTGSLDAVSENLSMQLKVVDSQVMYSLDGTTWLPFSGEPTVYIIYKEKGYDLTITKTVEGTETEREFDLTIRSSAITENSYSISGYEVNGETVENIEATPASGSEPGTITLKIKHGDRITISALQHGSYTLTEPGLDTYEMSATIGGYPAQTANNATTFVLQANTTAGLTNTPSMLPVRILKKDENGDPLQGAKFSLQSENAAGASNYGSLVSGTDGYLPAGTNSNIYMLSVGTWTLTETSAPEGYVGLGTNHPVTITVNPGSVTVGDASGNAMDNVHLSPPTATASTPLQS